MKSLTSTLSAFLIITILCVLSAYAQLSGPLSGVITAGTYTVVGEISVEAGDSLTIEPGTFFIFQGHYKFIVNGWLFAEGTETDSITFTAADTTEGWHAIRFINTPDSSRLSYCVLQYGNATGSNPDNKGGAIYCSYSSPIFDHCTIRDNFAEEGGGAIYSYSSNIKLGFCDVFDNHSLSSGGGLYAYYGIPIVHDCNFIGNIAYNPDILVSSGGMLFWHSSPIVENCTVANNRSSSSGGMKFQQSYNPVIANCVIYNNEAIEQTTGGLCVNLCSNAAIINCEITNNRSISSGGVRLFDSSFEISDCIIDCNTSTGISCYNSDGEIINTSLSDNDDNGIFINLNSEITFDNCLIVGNDDSGIHTLNSEIIVKNSLIAFNQAINNDGGGIRCRNNTHTEVDRCTIYRNYSGENGAGISVENYMPLILKNSIVTENSGNGGVYGFTGSCAITFSDFYNNENGDIIGHLSPGLAVITTVNANGDSCDIFHNIFEDPLFYSTTGDSAYYLTSGSPCIDAGDPNSPLDPDGTRADMGAYYFDQSSLVGDTPHNPFPTAYALLPPYPNPFNPTTALSYQLTADSYVELTVYDIAGREVGSLVDGYQPAGYYEVAFDGSALASGVYFARLTAGDFKQVQKLLLIK